MKLDFNWAVQNLHLLSEVQPYAHWKFYNPPQWEIKGDILTCDTQCLELQSQVTALTIYTAFF